MVKRIRERITEGWISFNYVAHRQALCYGEFSEYLRGRFDHSIREAATKGSIAMHDTAMQNGERFFSAYVSSKKDLRLLEIGSQNVNGSLRSVSPPAVTYVGVDYAPGRDVDVVLQDPYTLPFTDESFDFAVSSSCFEHSEMFWLTYLEIMRVLKPAGLFYMNAPSNGPCHRYPVDCWRFYPDCGAALVRWGQRNGFDGAVMESYISKPLREGWRDFVCVFIKDKRYASHYQQRILHSFDDFFFGVVMESDGRISLREQSIASNRRSLSDQVAGSTS